MTIENTTTIKLQKLATIIAVSLLSLVLTAAISGLLLAFYYEPSAGDA